jgi:hypothetical protein
MPKRTPARLVTDETLRETLAARATSAVIDELWAPAAASAPDALLPLVEPIWSFWMDAADLARATTLFAARQIGAKSGSSRSIPKLPLSPHLIELLETWFNDHHDGARASAREANYLAHYGLRLPGKRNGRGMQSSRFLDALHAVLLEAIGHKESMRAPEANARTLLLQLRRVHVLLSGTASRIVDGVDNSQIFQRLGESLLLGRADLLIAQSLLASPEVRAGVRGYVLVVYPEPWMPSLDQLRTLIRTIDSLSIFYLDLAVTSEALLLSIRFGNWLQATPEAATNWATFWQDDIARYLVAYQEVVGGDRPAFTR